MLQFKKVLNNFVTDSLENFFLLPTSLRMHEISKIRLVLQKEVQKFKFKGLWTESKSELTQNI